MTLPTELSAKRPLVLLAGNPNSGKTTLFNRLTGSKYKVANYPGVTVEKRTGTFRLPSESEVELIDLPGIYSLAGISLDEQLAASTLLGEDSPAPDLVLCVLDSTNFERNLFLLTQVLDLGVPVVAALNMTDLAEKAGLRFNLELLIRELDLPAIRISARSGSGIEELSAEVEKALLNPRPSKKALSWLAPDSPYRAEAETLGRLLNETKSPITAGSALLSETRLQPELDSPIAEARARLSEQGIDSYSFETSARYQWIHEIVRRTVTSASKGSIQSRTDKLLTHRIWGTAIFFGVMALIFQSIFTWAAPLMELIDSGVSLFGELLGANLSEGILKSLLIDGIVTGVGSVLIFIPQIAILTLFLSILEDTGYLTRAAVIMDRLLRPFGLQGRSFIPLLSSFACAIPGIMATRTIPSWSDRLTTILIAPLMSCSARLPVYAVLIAAFVPEYSLLGVFSLQGVTLLGMYLLGIIGACFAAWILKLTLQRGKPPIFVMEMPPFRVPVFRIVFRQVFEAVASFIKSAGTVILACSIILWFLASYPKGEVRESYAGQIGVAIEPVIKPLGYNWELGIALFASLAAREVFVSTLATVYNLQDDTDSHQGLIDTLKGKRENGTFSTRTALSLMVFYVFACQCMSTLAVCRRETGSWGWTAIMFLYMTSLAYLSALTVYQGIGILWG